MPHLLFIFAMYFSECIQTVLHMTHSTRNHSEVSNVKHFLELPISKTHPPSFTLSAVAVISQVDLLCVTPLKKLHDPWPKKINWNTEYKLPDAIQA